MADRAHLQRLARELVDRGKLIEAGWFGLRETAIPLDAPAAQLEEMRNAFFAGAQHLFATIMMIMDPDEESSDADLARMDRIQTELDAFIKDFKLRRTRTEGRA